MNYTVEMNEDLLGLEISTVTMAVTESQYNDPQGDNFEMNDYDMLDNGTNGLHPNSTVLGASNDYFAGMMVFIVLFIVMMMCYLKVAGRNMTRYTRRALHSYFPSVFAEVPEPSVQVEMLPRPDSGSSCNPHDDILGTDVAAAQEVNKDTKDTLKFKNPEEESEENAKVSVPKGQIEPGNTCSSVEVNVQVVPLDNGKDSNEESTPENLSSGSSVEKPVGQEDLQKENGKQEGAVRFEMPKELPCHSSQSLSSSCGELFNGNSSTSPELCTSSSQGLLASNGVSTSSDSAVQLSSKEELLNENGYGNSTSNTPEDLELTSESSDDPNTDVKGQSDSEESLDKQLSK